MRTFQSVCTLKAYCRAAHTYLAHQSGGSVKGTNQKRVFIHFERSEILTCSTQNGFGMKPNPISLDLDEKVVIRNRFVHSLFNMDAYAKFSLDLNAFNLISKTGKVLFMIILNRKTWKWFYLLCYHHAE